MSTTPRNGLRHPQRAPPPPPPGPAADRGGTRELLPVRRGPRRHWRGTRPPTLLSKARPVGLRPPRAAPGPGAAGRCFAPSQPGRPKPRQRQLSPGSRPEVPRPQRRAPGPRWDPRPSFGARAKGAPGRTPTPARSRFRGRLVPFSQEPRAADAGPGQGSAASPAGGCPSGGYERTGRGTHAPLGPAPLAPPGRVPRACAPRPRPPARAVTM